MLTLCEMIRAHSAKALVLETKLAPKCCNFSQTAPQTVKKGVGMITLRKVLHRMCMLCPPLRPLLQN